MDDDDDDAHISSYNNQQQLHHLYSEEVQGVGTEREGHQTKQVEDEDDEEEDGVGHDDEDEGKEDEEEEDDAVDGLDYDENNEDEKEEDANESHQFGLGQGNKEGGTLNLHMNGSSSSNGRKASPAPGLTALPPSQHQQEHHVQTPGRSRGQQQQLAGDGKPSARDDWTEPATHALLETWGEKYVQLNKGNLKQEDWEEVASAVSAMSKTHKTDVQCKNRLDTLKKKYKVEKQKQSAIGSSDSKWPFYKRLNQLLSTTMKHVGIPGAVDAGKPVTSYAVDARGQHFDRSRKSEAQGMKDHNNASTTGSKSKGSPDMTFSSPPLNASGSGGTQSRNRKRKAGGDGTDFKTLAKAITRFGEIYEKMEHSRQQQLMNLEKIRMEFTRDLELQRMQLFMQTQVEVAKMKHGAHDTDTTVSNLSG